MSVSPSNPPDEQISLSSSSSSSSSWPKNLFILAHGLESPFSGSPVFPSNAKDFKIFENMIQKQAQFNDKNTRIVRITSYVGKTPSDIKQLAQHLYDQVAETVFQPLQALSKSIPLEKQNPIKLFCLGHSLGGLIHRYALKLFNNHLISPVNSQISTESSAIPLETEQIPNPSNHTNKFPSIKLIPFVYISLATPHLGVNRPGGWRKMFNSFLNGGSRIIYPGNTMKQLQIIDDEVLLQKMADPTKIFHKVLKLFHIRILCSNIYGDIQVPYPSASISYRNPYLELPPKATTDSETPSIPESSSILSFPSVVVSSWKAASKQYSRCRKVLQTHGYAPIAISSFPPTHHTIFEFDEFNPQSCPKSPRDNQKESPNQTLLDLPTSLFTTKPINADPDSTHLQCGSGLLLYKPRIIDWLNMMPWRRIDLLSDSICAHDKIIGKSALPGALLKINLTHRWIFRLIKCLNLDDEIFEKANATKS